MDPKIFYDKAYNWLLDFGPKLIVAIIVFIIGQWIIKLLRKWLQHNMHKREFDPTLRPFINSLMITALQVLLILAVMQVLGLRMTIFTALIGGISVAAGLALSGTLQNFASGILILLLKPFRVGDNILAQGNEGIVSSIQIFYTVVTTYDNRTVIIPNSKLSNEVIVNLSREGTRRLDIEWKFNFGFQFDKVKEVFEKTIASYKDILHEPAPRIGVSTIEADGYKIIINIWMTADNYYKVKLYFQEEMIDALKKAGMQLPGM